MPLLIKTLALGIAALIVCSCVPVDARKNDPSAELAKVLQGRVAGPPVDCIDLPLSQGHRVIDHTAIVFDLGQTIYVNYPQSGAESLSSDDILVTKTYGTQLCRMDIAHMVDRTAGFQKSFLSLGPFIPYKRTTPAK